MAIPSQIVYECVTVSATTHFSGVLLYSLAMLPLNCEIFIPPKLKGFYSDAERTVSCIHATQ